MSLRVTTNHEFNGVCSCASASGLRERALASSKGGQAHGYDHGSARVQGSATTKSGTQCAAVTKTEDGTTVTISTCYPVISTSADPSTKVSISIPSGIATATATALADRVGIYLIATACAAVLIIAMAL